MSRRRVAGASQRGARRDAGSASIWMVGFVMVIWVTVAGVVIAGSATTARHRAATAADLSALAGASAFGQAMQQESLADTDPGTDPVVGPITGTNPITRTNPITGTGTGPIVRPDPVALPLTPAQLVAIACGAANSAASANGAHLRSCVVDGSTVAVEAAVALPRLARWAQQGGIGSGYVSARARAGPS